MKAQTDPYGYAAAEPRGVEPVPKAGSMKGCAAARGPIDFARGRKLEASRTSACSCGADSCGRRTKRRARIPSFSCSMAQVYELPWGVPLATGGGGGEGGGRCLGLGATMYSLISLRIKSSTLAAKSRKPRRGSCLGTCQCVPES